MLPVVEQELGWPDPNTGYSLRPNKNIINIKERRNHVATNNFGLQGPEPVLPKPKDVFRIAVVGDSFTEALEVPYEDNFVSILGRMMAAKYPERNIETLNFGVIGSGPVQQLYQWEDKAKAMAPDLTVFVISEHYFRSNELFNNNLNPGYIKRADGGFTTGYAFQERRSQIYRDRWQGKVFFALMDYSRIARAAYLQRKFSGAFDGAPGIQYQHNDISCATLDSRIKNAMRFWRDEQPEDYQEVFDHYLKDMQLKLEGSDGKVVIALYGLGLLPKACEATWKAREELHRFASAKFREHGLRVIDIDYEISIKTSDPGFAPKMFGFKKNSGSGHLNFVGHQQYAQALFNDLVKDKMLLSPGEL